MHEELKEDFGWSLTFTWIFMKDRVILWKYISSKGYLPYRSLVCNHMWTSFYSFNPKYSLFRIVVAAQRHDDLVKKDEELSIDGLEALQQKTAKQNDADSKAEE